jgi:cytochrome c5
MLPAIRLAAVLLCVSLYSATQTVVGAQAPPQSGAASGKDVLQRKCFQCHQPSMWASLRQDRRAWESTLYRMVGRGALWTEEEIRAMADFLAETRGPAAPKK